MTTPSQLPHGLTLEESLSRAFTNQNPDVSRFARLNYSHVVHSSGFDVYRHSYHKEGGDVYYRDRDDTVKCPLYLWLRRGKAAGTVSWTEAERFCDNVWSEVALSQQQLGRIMAGLTALEIEAEISPKDRV